MADTTDTPTIPTTLTSPRRRVLGIAAAALLLATLAACSDDGGTSGTGGDGTTAANGSGGTGAPGSTEAPGPTVPGIDTVPTLITANGTAFAFSTDGVRLAVSGVDDQVSMWEVATATQLYTIAETSLSLGFGGDGNTLFTYAAAPNPADPNAPILGPAHSWRLSDGQQVSSIQKAGSVAPEVAPVLTKKGAVVVPSAAGLDVYNARTAHLDFTIPLPGAPTSLIVSNGGGTIVATVPGITFIFDAGAGAIQAQIDNQGDCTVTPIAFSPDSKTLLAADGCAGNFVIWNPLNGAEIIRFGDLSHFGSFAGFTPDGSAVVACAAVTTDDNACQVWNVASGELMASLPFPAELPAAFRQEGAVVTGDISPDGFGLAVSFTSGANEPGWTAVYNLLSGTAVNAANGLSGAQYSPDGTKLAGVYRAAGGDALAGEVRVYDVASLPTLAVG
jgi:WD40 repeat protein